MTREQCKLLTTANIARSCRAASDDVGQPSSIRRARHRVQTGRNTPAHIRNLKGRHAVTSAEWGAYQRKISRISRPRYGRSDRHDEVRVRYGDAGLSQNTAKRHPTRMSVRSA